MLATLTDFERLPRILRLNAAGRPINWLSWQDAVCLYARDLVLWTLGDPVARIRGGHCRSDGHQSHVDIHSIIACNGKLFERYRGVPPLTNTALFVRDQHICLYCGVSFSDLDLTRDHVVPTSRGGGDSWDNVVTACRRCNHRKGNRLLEESSLQLIALPYAPNFAEYLALINGGRILGDQMGFLQKSFGRNSRLLSLNFE